MRLTPSRAGSGVHLGVHNPRTLRPSSDSSDTGKGNELAKSVVRCLFPVALKSLGPLALLGSTPSPGTNDFDCLCGGVRMVFGNAVSVWVSSRERRSARQGVINVVGDGKRVPQVQSQRGRSGASSIGYSSRV